MILRISLGVLALYAAIGAAESAVQFGEHWDWTMAAYALGYACAAVVCGLSAFPSAPKDGGGS